MLPFLGNYKPSYLQISLNENGLRSVVSLSPQSILFLIFSQLDTRYLLNLILLVTASKEVSTTFLYEKMKTLSVTNTGFTCCSCFRVELRHWHWPSHHTLIILELELGIFFLVSLALTKVLRSCAGFFWKPVPLNVWWHCVSLTDRTEQQNLTLLHVWAGDQICSFQINIFLVLQFPFLTSYA